MKNTDSRMRRALKTRAKIKRLNRVRLSIHRTPRHIYAQIISADGERVLAAASTVEQSIKNQLKITGNKDAAFIVGKVIAERALAKGIDGVAFDRSGFRFHGRVKVLADAAREQGLQF